MPLTFEQIAEMAPDPGSAAAGKKLMGVKNWPELGRATESLWGKCQGSAVYQVKIDLSNLGYSCSCPSRKFPCKHVLGLLMLYVQSPDAVAEKTVPDWMDDWLQKRHAKEEKKAEKAAEQAAKPVDEKAQQKRAAERESRVRDGLERLDLWLKDLVRTGLAGVENKPADFWDEQSKRLVDAQAPGVASRVARLAGIPRSSPDWPQKLLAELGRLKLLIHAFSRLGDLDPALASEVRQFIGWNVAQDELERDGERLRDCWVVAGQYTDDEDRIRAQRSWLVGRQSGRTALLLQFSPGNQPFAESILPGTEQEGTLVFYPGAAKQRAKFTTRDGTVAGLTSRMPGCESLDEFLSGVAAGLARQPWLGAFGGVLRDVTLLRRTNDWLVRDRRGESLPVAGRNGWKMLAVTGGHPFDLAVEWDGHRLQPLGFVAEGQYWVP